MLPNPDELKEEITSEVIPEPYETKFFASVDGKYCGGYAGPPEANPYSDAIEVPVAPASALDIWNGSGWESVPLPDIPGFFAALGKVIATGQLPFEIYGLSKMIQDQPLLADQQAMMLGFAQNPAYSNEQKKTLDALVKQFHLQLPEVSAK